MQHRVQAVLQRDIHQKGESYRIRSLYFDDPRSEGLFQNEEGEDNRLKMRIRFYDNNTDHLLLEVKEKVRGKTVKDACRLTREQFNGIMRGSPPRVGPGSPRPLVLLATRMQTQLLKPAIIVEYRRSAFVYPGGNTRVTFDRNISGSLSFDQFLEPRIPLMPILPAGQHLLEIKFDDYLPGEAAQVLEIGKLNKIAFSKYALCRLAFLDHGALPMTLTWPKHGKGEPV